MRPHIKKVDGLWWCDDKPKNWDFKQMMVLGMISYTASETPQLAYYEYCAINNKPHQGGIFDLPNGNIVMRRPI